MADWWTHEREKELRKLWAEGHSCSTIGDKIGNTRNAVIGKVHRLGLPERAQPAHPVKRPRKLAFPRAEKQISVSNTGSSPIPTIGSQLKVIESDAFKPVNGNRRILVVDLTSMMCRWPLGNPGSEDFTFCGATKCSSNDAYCQEHRRVASKPGNHIRDKNSLHLQVT